MEFKIAEYSLYIRKGRFYIFLPKTRYAGLLPLKFQTKQALHKIRCKNQVIPKYREQYSIPLQCMKKHPRSLNIIGTTLTISDRNEATLKVNM